MNSSMSNKDARVKDDGYIYMVLEYGEIDLAHMLSQKWKEMDSCDQTIDENWLRFYWQVLDFLMTVVECIWCCVTYKSTFYVFFISLMLDGPIV